MDRKIRSFAKSVAWRVVALLNGWIVTYCFMDNIQKAFFIAFVANVSGFILYYLHERLWSKVKWGAKI